MTKEAQEPRPARPIVRFRVGISGARVLRPDMLPRLRSELTAVLDYTADFVYRLSTQKAVSEAHALRAGHDQPKLMQLLSPLARGADRLAAKAADPSKYDLYVPMPFPQSAYEEDFTGTDRSHPEEVPLSADDDLREFRTCLAMASQHLELDGGRGTPAELGRAYEAAGRFVVRHSDLLIALWDGGPGHGRGGTAEIVHYAASVGVPVWWIHTTEDRPPVWIADIADLREISRQTSRPQTDGRSAHPSLERYLRHLIEPPPHVPRQATNWLERLARFNQPRRYAPDGVYFSERPLPRRAIWTAYSKLMRWTSGHASSYVQATRPADPVAQFWFDQYERADRLAGQYASRYRSSYVLVILTATLAIIFGASAFGLAVADQHPRLAFAAAACELASLVLIMVLVAASIRSEWHARSVDYRLLAELFRKQETLAPLGSALPIGNVQGLADTERLEWISWLFAAFVRAAPLPSPTLSGNAESRAMLIRLLDEQIGYHKGRMEMNSASAEVLESLGSKVFLAVVACVLFKILTEIFHWRYEIFDWPHQVVVALAFLAAVLPGVSAALVGIRRYAELELLADESKHMIADLERAKRRIARLDLSLPLASQDLGAEAAAVAASMLRDLEGWGRLIRAKLMEAG